MVLGLVSSADGIPGGIPQFRVLPSAIKFCWPHYNLIAIIKFTTYLSMEASKHFVVRCLIFSTAHMTVHAQLTKKLVFLNSSGHNANCFSLFIKIVLFFEVKRLINMQLLLVL